MGVGSSALLLLRLAKRPARVFVHACDKCIWWLRDLYDIGFLLPTNALPGGQTPTTKTLSVHERFLLPHLRQQPLLVLEHLAGLLDTKAVLEDKVCLVDRQTLCDCISFIVSPFSFPVAVDSLVSG